MGRILITIGFVCMLFVLATAQPTVIGPATKFSDALFQLYDNADVTKKLSLQLSGITTDTTRTWTVPDYDVVANAFIDWTNATDNFLTSGYIQCDFIGLEDSDGSHYLTFTTTSNLTGNKTLNFNTGDASRTLTLNGDAFLGAQNYDTDGVVTFASLNTGQGDNELYAMNQDIETTDDVIFNEVVSTTKIGIREASPKAELQLGGTIPVVSASTSYLTFGYNTYYDAPNWKRLIADNHSIMGRWADDGAYYIFAQTDENATVDSEITFANIFKIDNTGNVKVFGALTLLERSADPAEPAEGSTVIWMSDGTGKGDDGDVLIAGKAGGTTKWTTLFDHSAGAAW